MYPDHSKLSYLSYKLTPAAFVTQSKDVKENKLGQVDLLSKIKGKMFITPSLLRFSAKTKRH